MIQKGNLVGSGRTAQVYEYGENQVIKLFREGFDEYAKNEFAVCSRIGQFQLPAPAVYEMVTVEDRLGIVYERIEGRNLLEMMKSKIYKIKWFGMKMGELHFQIGQRKTTGFLSINEKLSFAISKTIELSEQEKGQILHYLYALPGGSNLCHFDFHPGNIICANDGMKLIDWSNVCIGNHCADVARTKIILQSTTLPPNLSRFERAMVWTMRKRLYNSYIKAYLLKSKSTIAEISAWTLPVAAARLNENIESEKEYLLNLVKTQLKIIYAGGES